PVMAFRRQSRGFEAVLFNHSTHCIGALTPGKRSPGFYGLAAQDLEAELGGTVIFLAGAFGSTHNLRLDTKQMVPRVKSSVRDSLEKARPHPITKLRALKREIAYRVREFDEEREDAAVSTYCKRRMPTHADVTIEVFRKMR